MKSFLRISTLGLTLAAIQAGQLSAQDQAKPETPESKPEAPEVKPASKPTREELKDKQLDVSLETRDVERVLGKLKRASELAKARITEAAVMAESTSTSLDNGNSKEAREQARKTSEMYKEIIKQLEALLAEETPQRVAAARNMAQRLAKMEREFAQQFPGVLNPVGSGRSKVDPKSQVRPQDAEGTGGGGQNKKMERTEGKGRQGPMSEPRDGQGTGKPKDKDSADPPKDGSGGDGKDPKDKTEKKTDGGGKSKPEANEKTDGGETGDPQDDPKDGQGGGGKKKVKDSADDPNGGGGEGKDPKEKTEKKTGGSDESDKDDMPKDDRANGGGGSRNDKPMSPEEVRNALARRAEQLQKMGETLKDVLQAIAQSNEPADKEAAAKLDAILKETDLLKALDAMKEAAEQIRSQQLDDARLSALDIAERLEITAQRLDVAYRTIVAPEAEELRKLEQALAELREKLETLETEAQIEAWHREMQDLLDQAEKLNISDRVRDDLLEVMKKAGLGANGARNRFNWGIVNNYYEVPDGYFRPLLSLQEEVQKRLENLLLGDIADSADDATPPKYQELVDQYYKVLSRSGKSQNPNSKSQTNPKSQNPKSSDKK